jgi:hypothetical protein
MKLEFNATVEKFMKLVELDDTLCIVGYKRIYDSDLFVVSNCAGYFMYLQFDNIINGQPNVYFAVDDDILGWENNELDMVAISEYPNAIELFYTLRRIFIQFD